MRLGWFVLLLLSFPVIEAVGIFWMAGHIGAWVLPWLLAAGVAGVLLIRFERLAWGARLLFTLQSGTHPLSALFASGRVLLAGGLLVFPGFVSDAIALGLLLMPGTWNRPRNNPTRAANDDGPSPQPSPRGGEGASATPTTIEGEFRREHDDRLR
ncbi:MAG: FxsA family protein [Pseudomonadota bacterium]